MSMRKELEIFREGLIQQRDELRVQAHLAKLEAMEEWEQAEQKLSEMERRLGELSDEAREASDDVWASVKMLGEEIGNAYERIRRHI
ncbi:MAG: hypothetical protein ACK443_06455 [Methylococcaceae bacterium]|jgi:hypothetical protein